MKGNYGNKFIHAFDFKLLPDMLNHGIGRGGKMTAFAIGLILLAIGVVSLYVMYGGG